MMITITICLGLYGMHDFTSSLVITVNFLIPTVRDTLHIESTSVPVKSSATQSEFPP